jgi:hypothetical protein
MMWWAFHEEQLDSELAKREAEQQKAGASEQQAKDETSLIKRFLASSSKLIGGRK